MATINKDFYKDETDYSDGEIENTILKYVSEKKSFEDIIKQDKRWPILYHLSEFRKNILSWYPFNKEAVLLEVGAGCGALTGLFCEKVKKVTAIELTERRSKINFERNKEYDNLEIIIGNFNNIHLTERYDYIILNGVLEYAKLYTNTYNPYVDFLNKMKELLKEDGVILIAIENRLGIKYLKGAREDHTGGVFDGINGYLEEQNVRTFSKNELITLLKDSNLSFFKFYYPFPDYKFPKTIYTDDSINVFDISEESVNYDSIGLQLFKESELKSMLCQEKIMDKFSNSFLVEASVNEIYSKTKNIIYIKLNNDREEQFRIITEIIKNEKGDLIVNKRPYSSKAKNHLDNMVKYYSQCSCTNIEYLPIGNKKNIYSYPFLNGINLETYMCELLEKRQKEKVIDKLKFIYETLLKNSKKTQIFDTKEFQLVFGETPPNVELNYLQPANIDLILDNIIIQDNKMVVIDYEWIFDLPIPVDFIMWRLLNQAYDRNYIFQKYFKNFEDLYENIGINRNYIEIYKKWIGFFSNHYVKYNSLNKFIKTPINMKSNIQRILREQSNITGIYIDNGTGYTEENKLIFEIEMDIRNKIIFDLSKFEYIKKIRWDPIEGFLCRCKIENLLLDNKVLEIKLNSESFFANEMIYFETIDPNIEFEVNGKYKKLEITFNISYLNDAEISDISRKINNEKYNLIKEKENLVSDIQTIYSSTSWKITKPVRAFSRLLKK